MTVLALALVWSLGAGGAVSIPPETVFPAAEACPVRDSMPSPLLLDDGALIKTPEAWQKRRPEIAKMFGYYEYGHMPPAPAPFTVTSSEATPFWDGKAELRRVKLRIGPPPGVEMNLAVFLPVPATRKYPVLIAVEPVWKEHLWPIAQKALERGYAFAGYERHDLVPDEAGRDKGVYLLYTEYDWAHLAVWAWGAMRVVDYLAGVPEVDMGHLALTGHSRAGKVALWAGALDERIALVAPHGSGAGGAGSFRLMNKGCETLDFITLRERFHYWFIPRLRDFAGQENRLPFDQHFLRALVAPRALVSMDGLDDLWANPDGTRDMGRAAQPVFDLLGASGRNITHFRAGGHDTTDEDWTVLLDYCDHFFFDKPLPNAQH